MFASFDQTISFVPEGSGLFLILMTAAVGNSVVGQFDCGAGCYPARGLLTRAVCADWQSARRLATCPTLKLTHYRNFISTLAFAETGSLLLKHSTAFSSSPHSKAAKRS